MLFLLPSDLIVRSATWSCYRLEVCVEWEYVADTVAGAARWTWLWWRSCLQGWLLLSLGEGTVIMCCWEIVSFNVLWFQVLHLCPAVVWRGLSCGMVVQWLWCFTCDSEVVGSTTMGTLFTHKLYNLLLAKGQLCWVAGKVATGLAESIGSLLLGLWLESSMGLLPREWDQPWPQCSAHINYQPLLFQPSVV